jgi:hypothetical protein
MRRNLLDTILPPKNLQGFANLGVKRLHPSLGDPDSHNDPQMHICVHTLISDGVFTPAGEFLPLPSLDTSAVMEAFRRLLLKHLHQAERLSENFMQNLLSWVHSGFSVFAGPPVEAPEINSLESQARYITRPALAMDALQKQQDGNFAMKTPGEPRTGATLLVLDPLEWIHRITAQIPDARQHSVRYYGAYSNRTALPRKTAQGLGTFSPQSHPADEDSDFTKQVRRTWARLLRKIFEVDAMLCPRCRAEMKIISIITDPRIVDRILRHRQSEGCKVHDPFEPRAPPQAAAPSVH